MDEKLDLILNKLNQLEKKIDKINEKIDQSLLDNCQKMSDHIDFIETVYDNVKNPLGFLCNKLNVFSGNNEYTLENLRESPQENDESSDD